MDQRELTITVVDKSDGGTPLPLQGAGVDELDSRIARLKIPGYRLIGKMGAGGMGRVYKARQNSLRRDVAIKILDPAVTETTRFRELFLKEIDILARLRHANVVTIFDAGEAGGLPYFVMEHVEGVTLRRLMAARDLTPAQVLAICGKICEGLEAAHRAGVVHRDLKPENVMVGSQSVVKIMDFGVAAVCDRPDVADAGAPGGFAGTRLYAAPEQRVGSELDGRADIYALGVMLYEMLTLSMPGWKSPPPSRLNPQCPPWLDHVVKKATAIKPNDRYGTASEMLAALQRGQDATSRTVHEAEVTRSASRLSEANLASETTLRQLFARLSGAVACVTLTVSLFLPYVASIPNLEWDRALQEAQYMRLPITAIIVGIACLALTAACLRNAPGRCLLQITLAVVGSVAMGQVLNHMRSEPGAGWENVYNRLGTGSVVYWGAIAVLVGAGILSVWGSAHRVLGAVLLYPCLIAVFVSCSWLFPNFGL